MSIKDLQRKIKAAQDLRNGLDARIRGTQSFNANRVRNIRQQVPGPDVGGPVRTASTINLGSNQMSHPMSYLTNQKAMLQNKLNHINNQIDKDANLLKNAEMRFRGGQAPTEGPQTLAHNLSQGLNSKMMPGNVGDINRVAWPFWFTTTKSIIAPNQAVQGNLTITQEAAFIALSMTKAVYLEELGGAGQYQFIDPAQPDGGGKSNGLTFLMRDSVSSRQFMNRAIDINQIGHWKYPSVFAVPQLFMPNANIEFTFQNNTNDLTYMPFVTVFGLRVRVDHAKDILSSVTG